MSSLTQLNELEKALGTTEMSEEQAKSSVQDLLFGAGRATGDINYDESMVDNAVLAFKCMDDAIERLDVEVVRFSYRLIAKHHIEQNEIAEMLLNQLCVMCVWQFSNAIMYRRNLLRYEDLLSQRDRLEVEARDLGVNLYQDSRVQEVSSGLTTQEKSTIGEIMMKQGLDPVCDFGWQPLKTHCIDNYYDDCDIGCVYAFHSKASNLVKIGKTKQPERRVKELRRASGCEGEFFVSQPLAGYHDAEVAAHDRFSDHREVGEWFKVSFQVAAQSIKNITKNSVTPTPECIAMSAVIDKYNKFHQFLQMTVGSRMLYGSAKIVIKD